MMVPSGNVFGETPRRREGGCRSGFHAPLHRLAVFHGGLPSGPSTWKMICAWLAPGMYRVSLPVIVFVALRSYIANE